MYTTTVHIIPTELVYYNVKLFYMMFIILYNKRIASRTQKQHLFLIFFVYIMHVSIYICTWYYIIYYRTSYAYITQNVPTSPPWVCAAKDTRNTRAQTHESPQCPIAGAQVDQRDYLLRSCLE